MAVRDPARREGCAGHGAAFRQWRPLRRGPPASTHVNDLIGAHRHTRPTRSCNPTLPLRGRSNLLHIHRKRPFQRNQGHVRIPTASQYPVKNPEVPLLRRLIQRNPALRRTPQHRRVRRPLKHQRPRRETKPQNRRCFKLRLTVDDGLFSSRLARNENRGKQPFFAVVRVKPENVLNESKRVGKPDPEKSIKGPNDIASNPNARNPTTPVRQSPNGAP